MAEAPAQTPEQIARRAGFAVAGAVPVIAPKLPPVAMAPGPAAAMKAPSAGTTEIIPGATDWIRQLVLDMLPTQSAQAAPPALPAARLGLVNNAPVTKPPPNFFERFSNDYLLPRGAVSPRPTDGVRG